MGRIRKIICSSSIENWREKIEKKLKRYGGKATRFYGLYHSKDYARFLECEGKKEVYWQGSDILQLKNTEEVKWIDLIRVSAAKHYCENEVQQEVLKEKGIKSQVKYQFWNDVKDYPLSYIHSVNPNIWLCAHPGREVEYGVPIVESLAKELPNFKFHIYGITGKNSINIHYHGIVPDKIFDSEIKSYQGALRFNSFDGISEVITKGALLGQYVISTIKYPCISKFSTPEQLLYTLKRISKQKYPNYRARNYYLSLFK